jgi:sugar lactone lactonase YvrE
VVFDDDGSNVVWEDIDLCELHKITLRYNRKTNVVSADTE